MPWFGWVFVGLSVLSLFVAGANDERALGQVRWLAASAWWLALAALVLAARAIA
jgi:hypothetical protein